MEAQPIIATEVVIEGTFKKDEEAEAVTTIDSRTVRDHLTEADIEINTKAGITITPLAAETHRKVTRQTHHLHHDCRLLRTVNRHKAP